MQTVLVIGVLLAASASAFVEVGKGYHAEVGIPLAQKIWAAENATLSARNTVAWDDRIVGGVIAPTNAHPYLAGLVITFVNIPGTSACGSSLVSPNRLVTAAHCWFDGENQARQYIVVLGSPFLFSGGTRIATSTVIMHPQWIPSTLTNDIAMIYLPVNVWYSVSIQPITLPNVFDMNNAFVGQWTVAAGYGLTSDQQTGVSINTMVSHVNLQVITNAQCQNIFGVNFVRESTICTNGAGGVGICRGDSGGPLVLHRNGQPIMIGVSSFVARGGCQQGFPSAFARVTSFLNFIWQHL